MSRSELLSNPRLNILSVVIGLGMAFYLAIEPTPQWLLLVLVAIAGFGLDFVLRQYIVDEPGDVTETAVYLIMPILTVIATGISLEHILDGFWALPVAISVTPAVGAIFYMLCVSLDNPSPITQTARIVLNAAVYLVAFAFYSLTYEFDLGVIESGFVVGLASALLTPEILRESEDNIYRLATYGAVVGYVMAQARWALDFTPLDGLLGAAFLLTSFYVVTGLLQHYFARRLNWQSTSEFATTALVALFVILVARVIA